MMNKADNKVQCYLN